MKTLLWTLAVIAGVCTCGLAFIPIVAVVLLIQPKVTRPNIGFNVIPRQPKDWVSLNDQFEGQ